MTWNHFWNSHHVASISFFWVHNFFWCLTFLTLKLRTSGLCWVIHCSLSKTIISFKRFLWFLFCKKSTWIFDWPDSLVTKWLALFLKSVFSTAMFIAAQISRIVSPSFFLTPWPSFPCWLSESSGVLPMWPSNSPAVTTMTFSPNRK